MSDKMFATVNTATWLNKHWTALPFIILTNRVAKDMSEV